NATQQALSAGKTNEAIENTQQIQELSQFALGEMRLLIFELRPRILEVEGLAAALQDRLNLVEARTGFNTSIRVVGERPLDPSIESELYAIANESLNNALKHSKAEQVTVILEYTVDSVCLQVWDDGIGFDQSDPDLSKGFGLRNMEERASRMGGSFSLDSAAGAGTVVEVEVAA
ncbi:MAG: histidine kinase, partial [Anaerolineales bacterium]|nr:histidine kinase [Anaerolineales bacterium]